MASYGQAAEPFMAWMFVQVMQEIQADIDREVGRVGFIHEARFMNGGHLERQQEEIHATLGELVNVMEDLVRHMHGSGILPLESLYGMRRHLIWSAWFWHRCWTREGIEAAEEAIKWPGMTQIHMHRQHVCALRQAVNWKYARLLRQLSKENRPHIQRNYELAVAAETRAKNESA